MNGELAQLIWLATHGTRFLRTGEMPQGQPTVFQYVYGSRFDAPRRRRFASAERADDPIAWMSGLARARMDSVGLDAVGQRASLVATGSPRAERWTSQWTADTSESRVDDRIWYVHYVGRADVTAGLLEHLSLDEAMPLLTQSVRAALEFANTQQDLSTWVSVFQDALSLGEDEQAEIPYHPDLLPPGADSSRRRLLAAAARAYVFGGMGSWNDISFDGEEGAVYDEVTQSLYASVMLAVDAAANPAD